MITEHEERSVYMMFRRCVCVRGARYLWGGLSQRQESKRIGAKRNEKANNESVDHALSYCFSLSRLALFVDAGNDQLICCS